MNIEEIRISSWELKNEKQKNFQDRISFIKRWANTMKGVPDSEWSKGQAEFIDAQFEIAKRFRDNMEKTEEGRAALKREIEWIKGR